jgi:type IV secretory pathway VirJ component
MKKYIGKTIVKAISGAVKKTKQADAKVLNTVSKPFRKAQGATGTSIRKAQEYGMSTKARVAANDASRMAAQRLVKPSYSAAKVLAATGAAGAGAYALNEYGKAKKVAAEKKVAPKKEVVAKKAATQNSAAKPKPANLLALPKPANKTKEKVIESKSKPRAQSFKPENKLGRAKLTGGMGNTKTGYKKSSSTSRTGMKETTGRFKK